jgi:hypothetical protein
MAIPTLYFGNNSYILIGIQSKLLKKKNPHIIFFFFWKVFFKKKNQIIKTKK